MKYGSLELDVLLSIYFFVEGLYDPQNSKLLQLDNSNFTQK
jgi:hypothetical protein